MQLLEVSKCIAVDDSRVFDCVRTFALQSLGHRRLESSHGTLAAGHQLLCLSQTLSTNRALGLAPRCSSNDSGCSLPAHPTHELSGILQCECSRSSPRPCGESQSTVGNPSDRSRRRWRAGSRTASRPRCKRRDSGPADRRLPVERLRRAVRHKLRNLRIECFVLRHEDEIALGGTQSFEVAFERSRIA